MNRSIYQNKWHLECVASSNIRRVAKYKESDNSTAIFPFLKLNNESAVIQIEMKYLFADILPKIFTQKQF
jgi:hypothetical protein